VKQRAGVEEALFGGRTQEEVAAREREPERREVVARGFLPEHRHVVQVLDGKRIVEIHGDRDLGDLVEPEVRGVPRNDRRGRALRRDGELSVRRRLDGRHVSGDFGRFARVVGNEKPHVETLSDCARELERADSHPRHPRAHGLGGEDRDERARLLHAA
jgi:hypothetical protein